MAGAPGFEPGNGGTKNRCLTTWLRPNALQRPYNSVFEKHNRAGRNYRAPMRWRCLHGFISGHRHSGAAKRSPESSVLVLVQCPKASNSLRIGCISFLSAPTLWIPGSAARPRNDDGGVGSACWLLAPHRELVAGGVGEVEPSAAGKGVDRPQYLAAGRFHT
jgi:hypothetical protein